MFAVVASFTIQLNQLTHSTCDALHPEGCPHQNYVPDQTFIAGIVLVPLFGLGVYLIISKPTREVSVSKLNIRKLMEGLDEEEKKIIKVITDSNGMIFQSELMEKTGFSKVKVTRLLDKLEGKNLIERRRRGMTNAVVLKP
jgi:uncharacterized membrane protein